ncbi:lipoma-preferred partner [Hemicordylus capensis]|uniref:lipoma-preferred partner n=1 Tax=Hemicordylus capensis TaxID=884348 RepID=UPI00230455DA|nr:lipoma-preferred partner [Hemicordylus capensis]XP_053169031.1 lipoma-preferred partner [Hemicordylus capensis]XP_053169032.1 lipoma-preferred partner [Hemicordylus capensis]XP_053169034.1 lipoma-preferred partner [Hemicordylus capensis]
MSHPSWLPPKNSSEPVGHVTARMETTHAFGTPSISISTQQTPKKFAPVVAPKPKYNPYRQPEGEGDLPPPPPPPLPLDDLGNFPPPPDSLPPPLPPPDEAPFSVQANPGGKTLEERRSSLDAEIDSLTSILADLENSSPYKPRTQQGAGIPGGSPVATPPVSTPVTGHKRMVIPNQPPLTATKKSASKPGSQPSPIPVTPVGTLKPQPMPAPYTTASTSARPTFNVQVKSAQPAPHFQPPAPQYSSVVPNQAAQPAPSLGPAPYAPSPPRLPDYSYAAQPAPHPEPSYGYAPPPPRYPESAYPGGPSYGGRNGSEPPYLPQNAWKPPEQGSPSPGAAAWNPTGQYPPPNTKKTYITDPPLLQPKSGQAGPGPNPASNTPLFRPEDELEHLTKKMLYDMENPPSEEYFGRCSRCGENVVGEGTGCTAMDQVFHVECFTCMTCNNTLRGQPFYAVEKKAYCEPCYINTLEQCSVCAKPIMERILRATGKAYHPHCFTCVICQRSLDGIPFTVDAGGNIHCIEDFHRKFAPRCSVCKEPIMPAQGQEETVRIVALDRDFHVQCYRCEDCGGLLSEGDNQGCYPLDGHILCKTCNSARIQALTAKASTDL